ncbi:MAG TPA: hypothetical protein VK625_21625, partial [Flavitalea sp.]|nr:hypothetical protein [Flavitalea sp.]
QTVKYSFDSGRVVSGGKQKSLYLTGRATTAFFFHATFNSFDDFHPPYFGNDNVRANGTDTQGHCLCKGRWKRAEA